MHLAPGAYEIYDGGRYGSFAQSTAKVNVLDAARDGQRVVLQLAYSISSPSAWSDPNPQDPYTPDQISGSGGGAAVAFAESTDLGKTFHGRSLSWDTWQGVAGPLGVILVGGRAFVEGSVPYSTPKGDFANPTLRRFDPSTWQYVADPKIDGHKFDALLTPAGANIAMAFAPELPADATYVELISFDPSQDQLTQGKGTDYGRQVIFGVVTTDGRRWSGLDGDVRTICAIGYTLGAATVDRSVCLPTSSLPPPFVVPKLWTDSFRSTTRGPALAAYDATTDINAVAYFTQQGTQILFLGGGSPAALAPGRYGVSPLHDQYGGFLAFDAKDRGTRLVDVPASGPARQSMIPRTPCSDDVCGVDASVVRVLSLDGDNVLVFYIVNTAKPDPQGGPATHEHIYVLPMQLAWGAVDGYSEQLVANALPDHPDAIPAGPLEAACTKCAPGRKMTEAQCETYWSQWSLTNPARQRFLTGDCSAWVDDADVGQMPCAGGCAPGNKVLYFCGPGQPSMTVLRSIDCTIRGGSCSLNALGHAQCNGGGTSTTCGSCEGNRAVICLPEDVTKQDPIATDCSAQGGVCIDTPSGPVCGVQCTQTRCNGTVAEACNGGTMKPVDCADVGEVCTMSGGAPACTPAKTSTACPAMAPTCDGAYLLYCRDGALKYVDCVAAGWKTCGTTASGPGCIP